MRMVLARCLQFRYALYLYKIYSCLKLCACQVRAIMMHYVEKKPLLPYIIHVVVMLNAYKLYRCERAKNANTFIFPWRLELGTFDDSVLCANILHYGERFVGSLCFMAKNPPQMGSRKRFAWACIVSDDDNNERRDTQQRAYTFIYTCTYIKYRLIFMTCSSHVKGRRRSTCMYTTREREKIKIKHVMCLSISTHSRPPMSAASAMRCAECATPLKVFAYLIFNLADFLWPYNWALQSISYMYFIYPTYVCMCFKRIACVCVLAVNVWVDVLSLFVLCFLTDWAHVRQVSQRRVRQHWNREQYEQEDGTEIGRIHSVQTQRPCISWQSRTKKTFDILFWMVLAD